MLIIQHIAYEHSNKDLLFQGINLTVNNREKLALVGNNGSGKSTLLKIMAGELLPSAGLINSSAKPYYVPQHFGQFNDFSIAEALGIDHKLTALKQILAGDVTEANLLTLDDDWTIEERSREALAYWDFNDLDLMQKMDSISGGQKTKIFLAGIAIHQPEIVLLDEPSNHLDLPSRQLLYDFIRSSNSSLVVVSHDRTLLNQLDLIYELSHHGLKAYGGNYAQYRAQKQLENNAFEQDLRNKEKALRKAKETERETIERQQKLDARGKRKQEKAGLPTISMNTLRNNAEKSTSKIKAAHADKVGSIANDLQALRNELPDVDKMKFGFDDSLLHTGKILIAAKGINYSYGNKPGWPALLDLQINSGERIALTGNNGSGKTTLIKLILGAIEPQMGSIRCFATQIVYIDQDYSLLDNAKTIYEQAESFNHTLLLEHEVRIRLDRFLFSKVSWNKPCAALSGGERMRLTLCCLTIASKAPDMIILDEPTNNLDLQNIAILQQAVNHYQGTLMVVSHDQQFLISVNANRIIQMPC